MNQCVCIRHKLLQFEMVHRLHLSRNKLSKMYPGSDSATCLRCSLELADLSHMFWGCPRLTKFWTDILRTLWFICNKDLDPNPLTSILGVVQEEMQLTTNQIELIAFSTLLARRPILLSWKNSMPPSHKHWMTEVMSNLSTLNIISKAPLESFMGSGNPF